MNQITHIRMNHIIQLKKAYHSYGSVMCVQAVVEVREEAEAAYLGGAAMTNRERTKAPAAAMATAAVKTRKKEKHVAAAVIFPSFVLHAKNVCVGFSLFESGERERASERRKIVCFGVRENVCVRECVRMHACVLVHD